MCPRLNREIFRCSRLSLASPDFFHDGSVLCGKEAVIVRMRTDLLSRMIVLIALPWGGMIRAQESVVALQPTAGSDLAEAEMSPTARCLEPPPIVRWQDYDGKLKKSVGIFARKLERKSVPRPHYKARAVLCTLVVKDKFLLFFRNTVDPASFLSMGFNAGLDQAQNSDPSFGQGAAGYGKRFGANFAGLASASFFGDFVYPTIFAEDPRYYPLAHGGGRKRLLHALGHAFVANREDGTHMVNASQWFASATVVALSNTYHPDNPRGVGPAAQRVAYGAVQNMGFDVLREFWPEIARKFRLPFRGETRTSKAVNAKSQADLISEDVHEQVRK